MKKAKFLPMIILLTITVFFMVSFNSCAGTNSQKAKFASDQTMYIEILENDTIWEFGKAKFEVKPGDRLEIQKEKICRGGKGICYKVKNLKTDEIGYVFAERMKERHKIYSKPEPQACNKNLDQLQRGMSKDQVKEIFGLPLQSGTTTDGHFYWIILTNAGTSVSKTERRLEYDSMLQLFWDKNNTLIGYRERCNGTWGNAVGLN